MLMVLFHTEWIYCFLSWPLKSQATENLAFSQVLTLHVSYSMDIVILWLPWDTEHMQIDHEFFS